MFVIDRLFEVLDSENFLNGTSAPRSLSWKVMLLQCYNKQIVIIFTFEIMNRHVLSIILVCILNAVEQLYCLI